MCGRGWAAREPPPSTSFPNVPLRGLPDSADSIGMWAHQDLRQGKLHDGVAKLVRTFGWKLVRIRLCLSDGLLVLSARRFLCQEVAVPTIPFLLPREDRFFVLMKSSSVNIHETAKLLVDLLENYVDVPAKVMRIKEREEAGDQIIHEIMRNLHKTFVTPLDREDIVALAERMDDVLDAIEEAARDMFEYGVAKPTDKALEMARIIVQATAVMQRAVDKLTFRGARLRAILPDTVEINRLENEADQVTSRAVGDLFRNGHDAVEIIKWREIYNLLETAADRCEDVANVLEGVVLKNA